jgi:hypothetical protein
MNFLETPTPTEYFSDFSELVKNLDLGPETEWLPNYVNSSTWCENIPLAFWLVKVLKPNVIVELGSFLAVSYMSFCQTVSKFELPTKCYAVDTWRGDKQTGFYGSKFFNQVKNYNDANFSDFSTLLRTTFDEARTQFENGSIDLLHIDGYHTYEAVKHDFETWKEAVSDRGVVIFHDVNVLNEEDNFGVWRFWKEICNDYPNFTFPVGPGLGVLGIGKNIPEPIKYLFSASPEVVKKIQSFFQYRGLAIKHYNHYAITINTKKVVIDYIKKIPRMAMEKFSKLFKNIKKNKRK